MTRSERYRLLAIECLVVTAALYWAGISVVIGIVVLWVVVELEGWMKG